MLLQVEINEADADQLAKDELEEAKKECDKNREKGEEAEAEDEHQERCFARTPCRNQVKPQHVQ